MNLANKKDQSPLGVALPLPCAYDMIWLDSELGSSRVQKPEVKQVNI